MEERMSWQKAGRIAGLREAAKMANDLADHAHLAASIPLAALAVEIENHAAKLESE